MKLVVIRSCVMFVALTLLGACQIRPPMTLDYDTQYNFSQLKSYAWIEPKDTSKVSTLDNKRQLNAIETLLNRKGFSKVADTESADFLLKTHTITDKKTDVDSFFRI